MFECYDTRLQVTANTMARRRVGVGSRGQVNPQSKRWESIDQRESVVHSLSLYSCANVRLYV